MPQTKHDVTDSNLWVFDVWPVQGLPDVTNLNNTEGVVGLMVVVHGEFEEIPNHANVVPLKRSFDRTFTLGPGGGPLNMRVINDIMVIRPWSGSDAWRPEPENTTILSTPNPVRKSVVSQPAGNSPNQHVIIEVGRRTGLNMRYAQLALEENNWNFEAALKAIEAAKVKPIILTDT